MSNKKTSIWGNYITPTKLRLNKTVWDDLRFPATSIDPPGKVDDPSFDIDEIGWNFANNEQNIIYIIAQFSHKKKPGTNVIPHIHWQQSQSGQPKWQIEYKWIANGKEAPDSWTVITSTADNVFSYSSGTIMQISTFGEISPPFTDEGYDMSSIMNIKLTRLGDDSEDTYEADVILNEFDIHFQIDTAGSFAQFLKYGE